ncbi:MAG TPA: hypothetical protein VF342_07340 [Alphaproteobacteria bacterium]
MLSADQLDAVLNAIDTKLATAEPVSIEDLEQIQKLLQARSILESLPTAGHA